MTIELLLHAIVRQTTILIGQLATSGGTRAPLAQVASQVFLDLVRQLELQGVSRKVSADMFGMGLRTYQRKIQRLTESSTDKGRSLWAAVLDFVEQQGTTSRADVLLHFARDDESQVRSVLHDLCESGLVSATGTGTAVAYRATPEEELAALRQVRRTEGLDELLWALIYREGPLTRAELDTHQVDAADLEAALRRLMTAGRVEYVESAAVYRASTLLVPLGVSSGWEAAVFDHYKALVNTITCRLREGRSTTKIQDRVGGSTYSLEVWSGHPLEQEVYDTLSRMRSALGDLRARVDAYKADHPLPENHTQVVIYAGQCLIEQESAPHHEPHPEE